MMTIQKMKAAAIVMVMLLLFGSGVGTLVYRLSAGQPPGGVEERAVGDDDPLGRDLKNLQGKWQMIHAGAKGQLRSVKEISGNKETLRRYNAATNKLMSESTVEFKLTSSGDVRVFTFYPVGGDPKQGASFVYKVDGDNFYDIPGLLQGNNYRNYQASPTIWHWKRVKEEPKKDASPP